MELSFKVANDKVINRRTHKGFYVKQSNFVEIQIQVVIVKLFIRDF